MSPLHQLVKQFKQKQKKKKQHTKTKQKCVKRQHCEAFWQNDLSSKPEGHRLVTAVPEHAMLNNPDKSTRGL